MADDRIDEILGFWFGASEDDEEFPTERELWFQKSAKVDRVIEKRFGKLVESACAGDLDDWATTGRGRLALILLLDQFPRNIHREHPDAFKGDEKALQLCFDGLDESLDRQLNATQRCFFYMPAMHAEDVDAQLASVEVFEELAGEVGEADREMVQDFLKHARQHRDAVERFDRFPWRNSVLGRNSSSEESAFLQHTGQL
ncbi:MAG: DUF924 family protein [Sandaracinaceae bacterium]